MLRIAQRWLHHRRQVGTEQGLQAVFFAEIAGEMIFVDKGEKNMKNVDMCGLVSRISLTERRENLDQLGFVNAGVSSRYSHFMRPPSPKPTVLGFLLSADTPQSGLANGPTWAALKKHRHCIHPQARRPAFLSGTEQGLGITVETGPFRVNDSLKGLWVAEQDSASGSGKESLRFHPCQTYGTTKSRGE